VQIFNREHDFSVAKFDERTVIICDQVGFVQDGICIELFFFSSLKVNNISGC